MRPISAWMSSALAVALLATACGGDEQPTPTAPVTSTVPTTGEPTTTRAPVTTTIPEPPPPTATTPPPTTTTTTSTTTSTVPPTTTTTTTTAPPLRAAFSSQLQAAMGRADDVPPCTARTGATGSILAELEGDLGVDQMIGLQFEPFSIIYTGVMLSHEFPMVTDRDDALALVQTKLYLNQVRTLATFGVFIGSPFMFGVARGDSFSAPGTPGEWEDLVFVEWDAETIHVTLDGATESIPFPWAALVRPPPGELAVGEETREEAWRAVHSWMDDIEAIVEQWRFAGNWRGTAELEHMYADLPEIEALLCVVLGTEWAIVDDIRNPSPQDFFNELAIQQAFLVLEYTYVLSDLLAQPDIDWLRGPDVDDSQNYLDGVTDTSEFIVLWLDGLDEAVSLYRELSPVDPVAS